MLDAGHGPETPGKQTLDRRMKEFEFNHAVTRLIKKELEGCGVVVILSHLGESDTPLRERTALANKLGVQVFVSIHANAYGTTWNEVSGIETFTYTKASDQSKILAKLMQASLCSLLNRKDRGIKQADFAVVRDTKMPAVLVECGFMTNKEEAALLQTEQYRILCAKAITFAILSWKNKS